METRTDNKPGFNRSVFMDPETDQQLVQIANQLYEGKVSMAFREAIRRMFRAEFESENKTQ